MPDKDGSARSKTRSRAAASSSRWRTPPTTSRGWAEHESPNWHRGADHGGGGSRALMHARIGMDAGGLNRHVERVFNPERKDLHWGRRKLARDR
jgi:hypothetical protein